LFYQNKKRTWGPVAHTQADLAKVKAPEADIEG
jgi:hypothetical protein